MLNFQKFTLLDVSRENGFHSWFHCAIFFIIIFNFESNGVYLFKCLCLLNDALHLPSEFQVNHIQFECFCLRFLIHSYLAKHVHESVCIIKIHWNIKKISPFLSGFRRIFFQHIDFIMNRKKTPGTRKVLENDREKFNVWFIVRKSNSK